MYNYTEFPYGDTFNIMLCTALSTYNAWPEQEYLHVLLIGKDYKFNSTLCNCNMVSNGKTS